jgi:hypothetical protein
VGRGGTEKTKEYKTMLKEVQDQETPDWALKCGETTAGEGFINKQLGVILHCSW